MADTFPDNFRIPTKRAQAGGAIYSEIGRTGLLTAGGYVLEEFLSEVSGLRWRRIVREMTANDSVVHTLLFLVDLMTRAVEWKVVAGGEDNESKKDAEFVKGCMDDMSQSWRDTVSEMLSYIPWGWSWHEVVYKERRGERPLIFDISDTPRTDENRPPADGTSIDAIKEPASSKFDDGMIGWRKMPIRSQDSLESWDFDDRGGIQAMHQTTLFSRARIPIDKSLLFRLGTYKNNPEGDPLCRHIYRDWYFKQLIQNIEGIGVERDLAGLPVGYMPSDYLDETKATEGQRLIAADFRKVITNLRRNEQEGVLMPSDCFPETTNRMFEIKLLSTGGTRQFDTGKIIQRYDQRILMTMMADFLLLGHDKVGSFALASSKTELFSYGLGACLDIVCDIFNRHAIPKLMRLNGRKAKVQPQIDHGDVESVDLAELADYISKISGTKVLLDEDQQRHLLKQGGLPVVDGKPLPEPPAPPPAGPQPGQVAPEQGGRTQAQQQPPPADNPARA
jgi:hypothetical protein